MRKRYIAFLILALALPLANGTPAFATDGRTAVGKCIDTPGCTYHCDPGGTCNILPKGDTHGPIVWCPSATGQCVVLNTKGKGPKGPVVAAPINPGKPGQAPPPPGGTKPVIAAPIVSGKPTQATPGAGSTESNHPILERSENHSGGGRH